MLREIRLENYRCYRKHRIELRDFNVIVGKNNAGKSTLAEALRIVSHIAARIPTAQFVPPPSWTKLPPDIRGISPSLQSLELDFRNITHRYSKEPAQISTLFSNGLQIVTNVTNSGESFSMFSHLGSGAISHGNHLRSIGTASIAVLPQVAPLLESEEQLQKDTIRKGLHTRLATRHFRNHLLQFPAEHFETLRDLVSQTWPDIVLKPVTVDPTNREISLMVRERDFEAEVGWMGDGLQIWLQMLWFVARNASTDTVILDEPDVYLHADLQRKLIRLLRGRFSQLVLTTHSVEIMSECLPSEVLIIDRGRSKSRFAESIPAIQKVVNSIGGVHNLQLTRLVSSSKCVMVEGGDMTILNSIHRKLLPKARAALDTTPNWSIGGWSGLERAIGSALVLRNSGGEGIVPFCVLDRDYHTEREVLKAQERAEQANIRLHVWKSKEVENYLLCAPAIARLVNKKKKRSLPEATEVEINDLLQEIYQDLRDEVFDRFSAHLWQEREALSIDACNKIARGLLQAAYSSSDGARQIVPGKEVLSRLSERTRATWGVPLTSYALADELLASEISEEVQAVILAIEKGKPFR